MASAWGTSWGAAWGDSWAATAVTPPVVVTPPEQVRMYGGGGGGAYRVRDEDIERLMKVLFKTRKKRRKKVEKVKELEDAAMALLNGPDTPAIRRVIVDHATPLLRGRARQAELQTAVEALLARAARLQDEYERELAEDEEDVLLLLGAM